MDLKNRQNLNTKKVIERVNFSSKNKKKCNQKLLEHMGFQVPKTMVLKTIK
jgi:hypothetical protein